jgi:hypothetical protein
MNYISNVCLVKRNFMQIAAYFWLFIGFLDAEEVFVNKQKPTSTFKRRDPVACSADGRPLELSDYSGWFVAPNYPDYYPNDANCQWLIRSQEPGGVS